MIFLTRQGKLDAGQDASLNRLTDALKGGTGKVLLHLHGGLVDEAAGKSVAERLSKSAADGGFGLDDSWTQVYVVWRTGALETVKDRWLELVEHDAVYDVLIRKMIEFALRNLVSSSGDGRSLAAAVPLTPDEITSRVRGRGDRRRPFAEVEAAPAVEGARGGPVPATLDEGRLALEFQAVLGQDADFNLAVADMDAEVNKAVPGRGEARSGSRAIGEAALSRLNAGVRGRIEAMRPDGTPDRAGPISTGLFIIQHAGKIALRCFRRFRTGRDHGLHATVVEEVVRELYGDYVGARIWGMMKENAAAHFEAGAFGQRLLDLLLASPPTRFLVSGHSAGSIWASEMLKALGARGATLPVELVLLAPAVRYDLFADALTAGERSVKSCRMFTMCDEWERKDPVLGPDYGYVYPSSLLYLVSGAFEDREGKAFVDAPILGMRRFMGANWLGDPDQVAAGAAIQRFFQKPLHDIVYAPSETGTMANSHGGFDDDPVTLKSIATMCA